MNQRGLKILVYPLKHMIVIKMRVVGAPPPISSVSWPHGEASELMLSMSSLLEAQTQMMAMQASAMAAQNLPPMPRFAGKDR